MRPRAIAVAFRFALLVAIAASASLVVDYSNAGDPAFCGVGSGCMAVRMSRFSRVFTVPLPWIGLAAFAILFVATFFARRRELLAWLAAMTAAGGAIALVLVGLQAFAVKAFCKWCVAVDTSAVVAAVTAVALSLHARREGADVATFFPRRTIEMAWLAAALAAIGLPFVWAEFPVTPELPPDIAALQVPNKITIVSFTDFECPFCRQLHSTITEVRKELGDRAAFVRKMVPLEMHKGAMPAARTFECVPEDKRDAVADALYAAPHEFLTKDGTIALATGLGVDGAALRACVDAKETQHKIDADSAMWMRLGVRAVPLTYVGAHVVLGMNPAQLRRAAALAASARPSLPVWSMLAILAAIFVGVASISFKDPSDVNERE